MKHRVFIDMDGTLAEYRSTEDWNDLYQENYFLTLAPNVAVCEAVRDLLEGKWGEEVEVFILSAYLVDSPYALKEKNAWLDVFFGPDSIDAAHRVFVPCGENKADHVPGGIRPDDILLDDYTKNLAEWEAAGGRGLKLLNGINATKGTWRSARVSMRRNARSLASVIYGTACSQVLPLDAAFRLRDCERPLPFTGPIPVSA